MEKRNLKIYFGKSGNGTGATLRLPVPFLREIGVTQDEREIELVLDKEKGTLTISKRK